MRKVNLDVLRDWVVKKVTQLVGFEDEVVIEYVLGMMEDKSQPVGSFPVPIKLSQLLIQLCPRNRTRILVKCRLT